MCVFFFFFQVFFLIQCRKGISCSEGVKEKANEEQKSAFYGKSSLKVSKFNYMTTRLFISSKPIL